MRKQSSVIPGAAVDVDGLAGDEATVVADKKEAGGGDLVHLALTAQGDAGGARRMPLIPFGIVPPCVDAAGGDHVGPNVVRGELGGQPSRQPDQPHLRRRDMSAAVAADKSSLAGEEQDAPVAVLDHRRNDSLRAVKRSVEHDAS